MSRKTVFVLGLNDFNLARLRSIHSAGDYDFVGVIAPELIYDSSEFDVPAMLRHAEARIAARGVRPDAVVERVPSDAEMRALAARLPGTVVDLHVREGVRLSELPEQDSYSYVLAIVYLGVRSQRELPGRYRRAVAALPFRLAPARTAAA